MKNKNLENNVCVWKCEFYNEKGYFFFVPERFAWNHIKQIILDEADLIIVPKDDWKIIRKECE